MNNVHKYDIGCEPSPSIPSEILIQDGWHTFLLFFAVSKDVNEKGFLDDLGVVILECVSCAMTKFGYPNDEGMPEHPLYENGINNIETSIIRVSNSQWLEEVDKQMSASTKRIWGERDTKSTIEKASSLNHFIITLKELTFECLASDLHVVKYVKTFDEAITYVHGKLE